LSLDGRGVFEIVICCSRHDVRIGSRAESTKATIVLASTPDQADIHQLLLASLALVSRQPGFGGGWIAVRDPESLRRWCIHAASGVSDER
jgi:hypothetical protein